jgi:uroporphyrinogen-III synthase
MGFVEVASAGGNVNDLANLVAARLQPPARLLYLAGEERAGDLAGALRSKNFEVDLVVVYRFLTAQFLPEPAAAALAGEIDAVLHFSRASAEDFLKAARNSNLLEAALTKPVHLCLSEQVAVPLREAGAARIQVAAQPTQDALLELCG